MIVCQTYEEIILRKIFAVKVSDISGPGVTPELIGHLSQWGINTLTDVQVQAVNAGIAAGRNLIISAPTSSGKTLVGEIAVLTALKNGLRAIYLVSHKALADQKYLDFVSRFGEGSASPIASVGLNTGDRAEGDINAQLMVATYEKAFGLILAGQLIPEDSLVVADELQILGDPGRGPDIEALCAVLKKRGLRQFVALTATVQNPEDLAGWMGCDLVRSTHRDVPLHQEIWYEDQAYRTTFGQETGEVVETNVPSDVRSVVSHLLNNKKGPVLVFTETKNDAAKYAEAFGRSRPKGGIGIALAEQLDLFSEPTESSQQLKENAERGVAFHTADLSPQERQVLETGFSGSKFDVCFATSTLAAGVNFPFRTVVFTNLTFSYRTDPRLQKSDYRNMSGRAGRLGMHDDGFAILLPKNKVELAHANELVLPSNDSVSSQLISLSLRKTVLTLIASHMASSVAEITDFFTHTLYWHQILERNPPMLETLKVDINAAVKWLLENDLINQDDGVLLITPLGKGSALSGLLPTTAVQFSSMLKKISGELENDFDSWIPGLIYAVCACTEFYGDRPSRFLPYVKASPECMAFWASQKLPIKLDRSDLKLGQSAQAITLFVEGLAERKITFSTKLSSGGMHKLAIDVAWVMDGLHKISCIPDIGCPQNVSNRIAMLSRRVRWGAPAEVLDVMRVAERHNVPGFGRQRAMALFAQGVSTLHDVIGLTKERLSQLLKSDTRAQALLDAVSSSTGFGSNRLAKAHAYVADELGLTPLVNDCNDKLGTEYERAICALLQEENSWVITVLDDGIRQNVPDFLIELDGLQVLMECKTCTRTPPVIKKEDAWAVLQKSADYDSAMRRVTLGKPGFDEALKSKAAAAHDITLVEHNFFMEGLLRVLSGKLSPKEFLMWASTPGVAEIDRLPGSPTFVKQNN